MSRQQFRSITETLNALEPESLSDLTDDELWDLTERLSHWNERAEELMLNGTSQRDLFHPGLETGRTYRFIFHRRTGHAGDGARASKHLVFCGETKRGAARYYAVKSPNGDHELVAAADVFDVEPD